jgi:hypothetical protein
VGGDEDDAPLLAGCPIGHGASGCDAGGDGGSEQGGAGARFAIQEGEVAEGDALFPEPLDLLGGQVGEQEAWCVWMEVGGQVGMLRWVGFSGDLEVFVEASECEIAGLPTGSFAAHFFVDELEGGIALFVLLLAAEASFAETHGVLLIIKRTIGSG